MGTFEATFSTSIYLTVRVDADGEDDAAEVAWDEASAYLETIYGDGMHVVGVDVSLDGIGAADVRVVS